MVDRHFPPRSNLGRVCSSVANSGNRSLAILRKPIKHLFFLLQTARRDLEFDLEDPHVEAWVAAEAVVGPATRLSAA